MESGTVGLRTIGVTKRKHRLSLGMRIGIETTDAASVMVIPAAARN